MNTRELLKAQKNGATIIIETTKREATYSPRFKGDREPWAYTKGINTFHHRADKCEVVYPEPVKAPEPKVSPEVIEALRMLRNNASNWNSLRQAADVLDNAGVFMEIDEATGYDVNPEPVRISRCNCSAEVLGVLGKHGFGCPGDVAEWGDLAFTTKSARRECPEDDCTGVFSVNKDGKLRQHQNDSLEICGAEQPDEGHWSLTENRPVYHKRSAAERRRISKNAR